MEATPAAVERGLVAAFKALPGRAYWLTDRLRTAEPGKMGRTDSAVTAVLNEAASVLAADPTALEHLLGWARCRAWGASYGDYCRARTWNRSTAEAGRRRAALAIARARDIPSS